MNKKDDDNLASYSDLSEAIRFFLYESFRHLESEMSNYIAARLFGEKLKSIDTTEEDDKVVKAFTDKIETTLDLINFEGNPLSEETITRMTKAWHEALNEAESANIKFSVNQELKGRNLMG